jgi:dinuclear metal center YbgI/SA1388 family protein
MTLLREMIEVLEDIAPLTLAEAWDNVGLLVGDEAARIHRVMTCLTVSQTTMREAIDQKAQLIVTHHPILFRPIQRITTATPTGRWLLDAIRSGIAIYSPHTAWDNAHLGINRALAERLALSGVAPISASPVAELAAIHLGTGIHGTLPQSMPIHTLLHQLGQSIPSIRPRTTKPLDHVVSRVGIVCGSGGSLVPAVAGCGCDCMLTGEATYHQCLEADALGVALILIGHFASEFFAMQRLADLIQERVPDLECFASQQEYSDF